MTFSIHWTNFSLTDDERIVFSDVSECRDGTPAWCDGMIKVLDHPSIAVRCIALDWYAYFIGPTQNQGAWDEPTDRLRTKSRACAPSELH
jgi:hypothetical protein